MRASVHYRRQAWIELLSLSSALCREALVPNGRPGSLLGSCASSRLRPNLACILASIAFVPSLVREKSIQPGMHRRIVTSQGDKHCRQNDADDQPCKAHLA
jgi:hypothetical protein